MRKLVFLGSFPPPYGGVAIFNSLLYQNLCQEKVAFRTLKVGEDGRDGCPLELGKYIETVNSIEAQSVILDSANMFLEYPADRVSFYRGYIWCFYKKMRKNRWIKILHDGSFPQRYEEFSEMQRKFVRSMMKKIDCIVVVNPLLEKWLRSTVGYKKRVETIGSLLPMKGQREVELPSEINAFLKQYDKILLTIGTCDESYGFQQIIMALRIIKLQTEQIKIGLIAIDGNFATNSAEYELKRNAIRNEKDVLLVAEGMPHEMVMELMKKSDVFIRGFSAESYGISRVESILCGTPVIATNVGKTDGMRIYEFGDIKTLVKHIKQEIARNDTTELEEWKKHYENEAELDYEVLMNILKEK